MRLLLPGNVRRWLDLPGRVMRWWLCNFSDRMPRGGDPRLGGATHDFEVVAATSRTVPLARSTISAIGS